MEPCPAPDAGQAAQPEQLHRATHETGNVPPEA
jgi:hypothetical protein